MDIENIQNRYRNLPKSLREAIASFDVASVVQNIVEEHRLHIDQGGELADEIDNVLVGDTGREIFLPTIKKRLHIDDKTAKDIVRAVNDHIFVPIQKNMQAAEENAEDEIRTESTEDVPQNTAPLVNTDALAEIEKDKYREQIENADIVSAGFSTNSQERRTNQKPLAPKTAGDTAQKTKQPETYLTAQDEKHPSRSHNTEESQNDSLGTDTKPHVSMVRNLMDAKSTPQHTPTKKRTNQNLAEQKLGGHGNEKGWGGEQKENAAPAGQQENNTEDSVPAQQKKSGDDPYREPIE